MSIGGQHGVPGHNRTLVLEGRMCGDFGGLRDGKQFCLNGHVFIQSGGPLEEVCRERPAWKLYRDDMARWWLDVEGTSSTVRVRRKE